MAFPMRIAFLGFLLLTTFGDWSLALGAEPVSLGPHRQLVLDNRLIASGTGLKRVWYSAVKYKDNPVLKRDKPWEGRWPYMYGTALYDQQARQFKLWYNCFVSGRPDYCVRRGCMPSR